MMRISEIYIRNYLQFRDFHLDLTDPDTGEPLEKVCFIGANGTGKSTLLKIIFTCIAHIDKNHHEAVKPKLTIEDFPFMAVVYFLIKNETGSIYVLILRGNCYYYSDTDWNDFIHEQLLNLNIAGLEEWWHKPFESKNNPLLIEKFLYPANTLYPGRNRDLVCYAQSDKTSLVRKPRSLGINNKKSFDLPVINLNQSIKLFELFPLYHDVSWSNVEDFWRILIYQIKKREGDYLKFLEFPENQNLTISEVRAKFDRKNPEILVKLAEQWNLILEKAGLEFDVENAKIPVQLTENLEAYIRLRETKQNIPYNSLSTGIRNFIFQLGHIYALYFNRDIQRGFLLIDEPELSLFPDLLYDIIDRYLSIIQNTQFFVATHSPIIAAQFAPTERFILEFDDEGYVTARLGVSPEGDDPNDLLTNDFVVRSLYGKKGIEQWERYLELRRKIVETDDKEAKKELLKEYSRIGNAYNFLPNEISE